MYCFKDFIFFPKVIPFEIKRRISEMYLYIPKKKKAHLHSKIYV